MQKSDRVIGCLLGTAVGDAIGLPYEDLSRQRARRMLGPPDRHRLVFGRGMVSDDTEQTCIVAQSLIASGGDIGEFKRQMSRRLRIWLIGCPAGIGFATLRAILRLWIGFGPDRSGVFSAGNGPAMRAAIIGTAIEDAQTIKDFVRASTRITHTDPKAEYGALAVAFAARISGNSNRLHPEQFLTELQGFLTQDANELLELVGKATRSVESGESTTAFAESIGLKRAVTGYVYHTVPVALHAWLTHQSDFRSAIESVIDCGGDTDTTAAIVGGIVGSSVGKPGIPVDWLNKIIEWPKTVHWIERLGEQCSNSNERLRPLEFSTLMQWLRNAVFLLIVLFHGFRRLLPPY